MPLVNLKSALQPAFEKGYAVGSFNVINSTFAEAILCGCERKRSPVIISIAEVHLPYQDLEPMVAMVKEMAAGSDLPVVLNLDHGLTMSVIEQAIRIGFTSIMFDGSSLPYEENIAQTRAVVELCRSSDISVEAELGAVGGSEDGDKVGDADPSLFTDPAQAEDFVARTGIDALAVAIGNVHGKYRGEPHLDFARLEEIRARTGVPLVLHGGSGISADDFRKGISLGIAKINIFTSMAEAALQRTRTGLEALGEKYNNDYPDLVNDVKAAIQEVVEEQIDLFGSGVG